nr:MAG TPA: Metal binding domain of Ada [Caudoviricetes sp.]
MFKVNPTDCHRLLPRWQSMGFVPCKLCSPHEW